MMKNLDITAEEADLMDKIFSIKLNEKGVSQTHHYAKALNVSKEEFKYSYNTLCEIGGELEILVAQKFNSGDYAIVSIDNYKSEKFLKKGGFKEYFNSKITLSKHSQVVNHIYIFNVDFSEVEKHLKEYKVSDEDIIEIRDILTKKVSSENETKEEKVQGWKAKMLKKAKDGSWQVGAQVAGQFLYEFLKG